MLNSLLHPPLDVIVGVGIVLGVFGYWDLQKKLDVVVNQLDRTNRYLRHLAWMTDKDHGDVFPDFWNDPGA